LDFRLFFAILLAKLTKLILKIFGRKGSSLPGKLALQLYPEILTVLSRDVEAVVVSATNGKTTTVNILKHILNENGKTAFANSLGSNMEQGIVSDFILNADVFGKPEKHFAVIECDEAALKYVTPKLKPKIIAILNVFRDQLDRFSELSMTLNDLREGLRGSKESEYLINADCSLVSSIVEEGGDQTRYFGFNKAAEQGSGVSDAVYCIKCGNRYDYAYKVFAHFGDFSCTHCGYKRQKPEYAITHFESDFNESRFVIEHEGTAYEAELKIAGLHNIYNALAAVSAANMLGVNMSDAVRSLKTAEGGSGRGESFLINKKEVSMMLIKNPSGADRAFSLIEKKIEPFKLLIALNTKIADGKDISWIWDADFEKLIRNKNIVEYVLSGERALELALRLKYAGAPEEMLRVIEEQEELLEFIKEEECDIYMLPSYTVMFDLRDKLKSLDENKEAEE